MAFRNTAALKNLPRGCFRYALLAKVLSVLRSPQSDATIGPDDSCNSNIVAGPWDTPAKNVERFCVEHP